ncbi:hypothetical protein J0A68_04375 [Algoriphagus sp. H41]|uniref:Uncharacterized protein n=1 Tax=Algoriphagus oliviformis TaxID=2811231 RepID=A0ABS3BZT0_9BACT|nr:hypothetical protein [Algoriphagus oliviformis]MBN7810180.1 hypothetical protein [Algoriphagus oliviformis]
MGIEKMTVQRLHIKAIELADSAFILKFKDNLEAAKKLFGEAFQLEKKAALLAKDQNIGEPTISVLLKSAASLAMNADELVEAEKLICLALCGEPPHEIAEELRNLLEELYFQRHLQLQGIQLTSAEIQLVIAGRGIGYGMAKTDLVFDKLSTFEKLTFRTAERKVGKPFRSKGDVPKVIKMSFQNYISVPRAASFAFTIRVGAHSNQLKLEGFENSVEIIEELVENIKLLNQGEIDQLKNRIPDETYLKNFISLSKELAPDGDEVNLVGFTIIKANETKDVQFTRLRSEISISQFEIEEEVEDKEKKIELTGRLSAADDDKSNIRLNVENDGKYLITVPDGLSDIVKKYWGEQVKIKGTKVKPRVIELSDIDPIQT